MRNQFLLHILPSSTSCGPNHPCWHYGELWAWWQSSQSLRHHERFGYVSNILSAELYYSTFLRCLCHSIGGSTFFFGPRGNPPHRVEDNHEKRVPFYLWRLPSLGQDLCQNRAGYWETGILWILWPLRLLHGSQSLQRLDFWMVRSHGKWKCVFCKR